MKKFLFPVIVAGLSVCSQPVFANNVGESVIKNCSGFKTIYYQFTKDNKPYVYAPDRYEVDYSYTIFDEDFNQVAKIELEPIKIELTEYSQQREYIYKNAILDNVSTRANLIEEALTLDEAIALIKENYGRADVITSESGAKQIVYYFFYEDMFGAKYPEGYFEQNESGVWVHYTNSYTLGDYGPYGEWGEIRQSSYTIYSGMMIDFGCIVNTGCDDIYGRFTQTFFNDDEAFEYVIPKYKIVEYSYEGEYEKSWGSTIVITGMKVLNDRNETVCEIDFPSDYYCDDADICYMNGKKYVIVNATKDYDDDPNNFYQIVYRIDGNSANPTLTAIHESSKVLPRTPRRGENVTVMLGDKASKNGCNVSVVSTSGQTVMTTKVPSGESTVGIDTSRFSSGVYVVTVHSEGNSTEAAKIIVR